MGCSQLSLIRAVLLLGPVRETDTVYGIYWDLNPSLWDLLPICVGDVGPCHGKAPSFPTPSLPHHEHPAQVNLSGDTLPLPPQAPLMAPSLLGGRQRRSGRLSGSKQTASSCSCSRKPSKKPSTSPSKPTPSVSTTPLSSPFRISSLGLMTPPRSPASPLSPLLVNKSGTHWWHLHLLLGGLSPGGHEASLVGHVATLFLPEESWNPLILWLHASYVSSWGSPPQGTKRRKVTPKSLPNHGVAGAAMLSHLPPVLLFS